MVVITPQLVRADEMHSVENHLVLLIMLAALVIDLMNVIHVMTHVMVHVMTHVMVHVMTHVIIHVMVHVIIHVMTHVMILVITLVINNFNLIKTM